MDLLKEGLVAPERLVNLRAVPGLDAIEDKDGALELGSLCTLARLAEDPSLRERYRAVADAAGHAATPQIRNVATVGGNLLQRPRCWYFRSEQFPCRKKGGPTCFAQDGENAYHAIFDHGICAAVHPSAMAVALVAWGARARIAGENGTREELLESIFVTPDRDVMREHSLADKEILTAIILPARPNATSAYAKQGERASFDWPLAEVAVVLEQEGGRCKRASVVLGAAAPVPHRAKKAEAALVGKAIDEASARAAAKAALQDAAPLEHNGYKLPIFEALIRRTVLLAARTA
jgi:xanthine dehydrogenase YagS FAD-binding subunit